MIERYGEAVSAAIESGGTMTTIAIQKALGIGFNDAARLTEKMVEDGIISGCDNLGQRTILKNFCGCCEACLAPLFEDDQYVIDDNGIQICRPAVELDGPCYADRVGGLKDAAA